MFGFLKKIFKSPDEKAIARLDITVVKINALEDEISKCTDDELKGKVSGFKERILSKKQEIKSDLEALKDEIREVADGRAKDKVKL
jgi:preprotein translocase subunit SecA